MKNLVNKKTERNPMHHDFEYEEGKKIPKEKPVEKYAYLDGVNKDGYRMLKVSDREDIAGSVDGLFIVTDELQEKNGYPVVNGNMYKVWGIGENYVIMSADGSEKHYIGPSKDGKVVVTHPNQKKRTEDLKVIHAHYSMLI